MRFHTPQLIAIVAIALAASLSSQGARAESTTEDAGSTAVESVWRVQSFDFEYRGFSTSYSCGSLRKRLRSILLTVGARDTLVIRTTGCYDLSELANVQITMASPVEATPANIRALTEHDSEDELIARVRGESLASAADIERFSAEWRTISMSRDKRLRLAPGDCELVQQLRREVFPLMSIRIVEDNLHCSRAFGSFTRPQLAVSALVATNDAHRSYSATPPSRAIASVAAAMPASSVVESFSSKKTTPIRQSSTALLTP